MSTYLRKRKLLNKKPRPDGYIPRGGVLNYLVLRVLGTLEPSDFRAS